MPTYMYKCPRCMGMKECVHSIHSDPTMLCPKCTVQMTRVPCGQVNFSIHGFSLRKRRQEIEKRYRDREERPEWKKMTDSQKAKAKAIADKYGASPWTTDPKAGRRKRKGVVDEFKTKQERQLNKIRGVRGASVTDE